MEVSLNFFTSQSGLVFQNHPFQAFFVSKTYIIYTYTCEKEKNKMSVKALSGGGAKVLCEHVRQECKVIFLWLPLPSWSSWSVCRQPRRGRPRIASMVCFLMAIDEGLVRSSVFTSTDSRLPSTWPNKQIKRDQPFWKLCKGATVCFLKRVPWATCVRRDRQIVFINRVYTAWSFFMKPVYWIYCWFRKGSSIVPLWEF